MPSKIAESPVSIVWAIALPLITFVIPLVVNSVFAALIAPLAANVIINIIVGIIKMEEGTTAW